MMSHDCACNAGGGTIAGWMKPNEFYCIKVKSDHGDGRYVLSTFSKWDSSAGTDTMYVAVKDNKVVYTSIYGRIYNDYIFMYCDGEVYIDDVRYYGGSCSNGQISYCISDHFRLI